LLRDTLGKEKFYEDILEFSKSSLGDRVVGIVLFGSYVYLGHGKDVDLLIIISRELDLKEKFSLERTFSRDLRKKVGDFIFDIHILGVKEFEENLRPGSFLSGLALGYEVLYDRIGLEEKILAFLERLSRTKYVLHNRHGSWDLSHMARIMLKIKRKNRNVAL